MPVLISEQVRNAERVQLDQIPLPDAPVDHTGKSGIVGEGLC